LISTPVTYEASADAKNATTPATSSGCPKRFIGTFVLISRKIVHGLLWQTSPAENRCDDGAGSNRVDPDVTGHKFRSSGPRQRPQGRLGCRIRAGSRRAAPRLDQFFTAEGQLNDVNDVKVGMVAGSAFAFVADGRNGLRVLQIVSPWDDPAHFSGFSPRPVPKLIASARTKGPALAISKGIDRDRAVDESGNQIAVFGRRGSRPLNRAEMQRLYLRDARLCTVSDEPVERPR
jgi:hypothetical protein